MSNRPITTQDDSGDQGHLQIDREVPVIVSKFPNNYALLLSGQSGCIVEMGGEKRCPPYPEDRLILDPLTYRLVLQNGIH